LGSFQGKTATWLTPQKHETPRAVFSSEGRSFRLCLACYSDVDPDAAY